MNDTNNEYAKRKPYTGRGSNKNKNIDRLADLNSALRFPRTARADPLLGAGQDKVCKAQGLRRGGLFAASVLLAPVDLGGHFK